MKEKQSFFEENKYVYLSNFIDKENCGDFVTEFKKLDSDLVQGWVMRTDDFLHEKYICCNLILKQRDEDSNTLSMAVPWS